MSTTQHLEHRLDRQPLPPPERLQRQAKRIQKEITSQGGSASLGIVQGALAKSHGCRDWNALLALARSPESPPAPATIKPGPATWPAELGNLQLLAEELAEQEAALVTLLATVTRPCWDVFSDLCSGEPGQPLARAALDPEYSAELATPPQDWPPAWTATDAALAERFDRPATCADYPSELHRCAAQGGLAVAAAWGLQGRLAGGETPGDSEAMDTYLELNQARFTLLAAAGLGTARYACANCSWQTDSEADLNAIEDLEQRVDPGDIVPAGECPVCGALCHPVQP